MSSKLDAVLALLFTRSDNVALQLASSSANLLCIATMDRCNSVLSSADEFDRGACKVGFERAAGCNSVLSSADEFDRGTRAVGFERVASV